MTMHRHAGNEPHQQQLLVKFQTQTHVLTIHDCGSNESAPHVLKELAQRTGWSTCRLQITHWNLPFVQVTVRSCLRGGKGGFGTLLKGQSRQAGAKLTTDFGACRDLQGRRLRHVNDEIKLRKFRERQRREAAGEKVDADDLWKTPSGIYNWHLMTPTWADISKKAAYRIKRQFQQMDRESQKKLALKKEQEEMYQKTMTHYLTETTSISESIQEDLNDAIKQGLKKNAAALSKKRKRTGDAADDVEETTVTFSKDDQPNALVSLTGEVVMEPSTPDAPSVQLQSKSEFMTAVLVLDCSTSPLVSYYYEVTLVTGGLAQIGWACLAGEKASFEPNNETGDGVGDDASSFAIDGLRELKFHDGQEWEHKIKWKAGDRLGCLLDNSGDESKIMFSLNGSDLGEAFSTKLKPLVPAFSCNQGEILELHMTQEACKYFPKNMLNVVAVKNCSEESATSSKGTDAKQAGSPEKETSNEKAENRITKQKAPTFPPSEAPKESVKPEALDLEQYDSLEKLEALGLDRLKSALMFLKVKCGGTLKQRAERLLSLKGLDRKDYPKKVRAQGFVEANVSGYGSGRTR
jgi:hypothetical protein